MLAKVARDTRPTTDARSERHLAAAMGYPKTWRVVRKILEFPEGPMIQDRIYAGNPERNADMWFNHDAARKAALSWVEGESTAYQYGGGHLLERVAKFDKNDTVQVYYEPDDQWYDATIVKRIEYEDDFRYTVHYTEEDSTQPNVCEEHIRPSTKESPEEQDEFAAAESLGLPQGWRARAQSKARWNITAPDGQKFRSKKAALEAARKYELQQVDEGDPPWRTTGHDLLGRRVGYVNSQKYSGTREVRIEQLGTVVGWISDTDTDKNGDPGFVSESGEPANLFHIEFDEDPNHPYANHLIVSQDLEEFELLECLLPEETRAESKRKRDS